VDDIFEAIMSLNASSNLELGLQNVTRKSQNPVPAYSQDPMVTNLEIGTIKTFEGEVCVAAYQHFSVISELKVSSTFIF
jgi:hypothetical protein